MSEVKTKGAIALEYAGFWRRFGAYIVDAFVIAAFSAFFEPLLWPDFGRVFEIHTSFDATIWAAQANALANVMSAILSGAYFAAFWVWRGQTLGMMLLGMKVIRSDGTAVDAGHAVIRYLGYIVSIIPLFLGFVWIAFDSRKQGWHDKIADTVVIKLPPVAEVNHAAPPTAAA
ncbi:RDD family protein [Dehalogenimonas alkenigignens]|jgi:uncharacterized RDD family membrane protein YckC|uniref:Putative membrane protein/domain n=1 Tax=Dehalogenimonas alkenigignens TaxID=1217799 RepID=A0A0W0GG54_9CHLR|nr:RDD family protein [Dehalogenimonas alkenigignens]KTB47530.1 putative membrane protein/domain [Dehalogenimonas alkenigignens]PVV83416.1 RDD family protein [Dehalogenimonas alkenigignens]